MEKILSRLEVCTINSINIPGSSSTELPKIESVSIPSTSGTSNSTTKTDITSQQKNSLPKPGSSFFRVTDSASKPGSSNTKTDKSISKPTRQQTEPENSYSKTKCNEKSSGTVTLVDLIRAFERWINTPTKCRNHEYGCQFSSQDRDTINRHEKWLCTHGPKCLICSQEYGRQSKITHLKSYHTNSTVDAVLLSWNDDISRIGPFECDMKNISFGITNCHGRTFVAVLEFGEDRNSLLVTARENGNNHRYTFMYLFTNLDNTFRHRDTLDKVENDNEPLFWFAYIPKFEDSQKKFNFSITVKKW